jgi:hypothetical protein
MEKYGRMKELLPLFFPKGSYWEMDMCVSQIRCKPKCDVEEDNLCS